MRDVPRVAVVTVLLCSYYFEFVVLFAYFLTRFCVVAVFQFLFGLCKPICYIYPCCQFFFFSDDQSVTYIHVVNNFFLLMINLLHISMLSIFFFLVMINLHCSYQRVKWKRRRMNGCLIFQVGIP